LNMICGDSVGNLVGFVGCIRVADHPSAEELLDLPLALNSACFLPDAPAFASSGIDITEIGLRRGCLLIKDIHLKKDRHESALACMVHCSNNLPCAEVCHADSYNNAQFL
jgi:hypothetical protein